MPNIRKLAYKDRYVWELNQTMTGGSSSLPPVVFSPGTPVTFTLQWTEEQFTEVLSALMTGADLSYPEKSHEVVWSLLKQIEYPMPLPPPAGNDSRLDLWAKFASTPGWTPQWNGNANQPFGGYINQVTPLQQQQYVWQVYLTPGTWNVDILYVRQLLSATATLYWIPVAGGAGATIGVLNMSGAFLLNQVASYTLTISDPQKLYIILVGQTTTPPSTGFLMNLTGVHMWRS